MSANTSSAFPNARFWAAATLSGLAALHLYLSYLSEDFNLFSLGCAVWAAALALLWEKYRILPLAGGLFSTLAGSALIGIVLLKSASLAGYEPFLRLSPLLCLGAVALLTSGFGQWKRYSKALFCLALLIPPPGLLSSVFDLTTLTAQFAASVLVHLGFDAARQGVFVRLAGSSVEVYPGCSGSEAVLHLLALAGVFAACFAVRWSTKLLVSLAAVVIAFVVNGLRVALMAYLVAFSESHAFEYWHVGTGSLIFSVLSVLLLGLFVFTMLRREEAGDDSATGH